jgi:hypothetical protein
LVSDIDILTDLSTTLYTQRPVGPLYCHVSPVSSPVYSLTWFDTSTCGDSALQGPTLPLCSETNARVIQVEAYALLFQATRDVSGLTVPRIQHSVWLVLRWNVLDMCKCALDSEVRLARCVRGSKVYGNLLSKDAGTRDEHLRLMCVLCVLYSILEAVACMLRGTHLFASSRRRRVVYAHLPHTARGDMVR